MDNLLCFIFYHLLYLTFYGFSFFWISKYIVGKGRIGVAPSFDDCKLPAWNIFNQSIFTVPQAVSLWQTFSFFAKKSAKNIPAVTGITLQPIKPQRLPRWHMKENGNFDIFLLIILYVRFGLVARHSWKSILVTSPPNESQKPPKSLLANFNNFIF